MLPHVLDFHKSNAETSLAELADLIGVGGDAGSTSAKAQAFIDAVVSLRESVGIGPTSDKIKSADFDYLIGLAVNESTGYFAPRLLTNAAARDILELLVGEYVEHLFFAILFVHFYSLLPN